MGKKQRLLILCLTLWAIMACSPKQIIQNPEFIKISGVELLDINRNDATIRVRLIFHNPNNFGCTMENITFSTIIDGHALGASRIQGTVKINGNENFELMLDTRLLLASVPQVVLSVFAKPDMEIEVKGQTTLVTPLSNMTFSFNPKSRVEVKDRMKNIIRMKLISRLNESGLFASPLPVAGK